MAKKLTFPSVFTFRKSIQPSAGIFRSAFGVTIDGKKISAERKENVIVRENGIRTSLSSYVKDASKINNTLANSNLQRQEVASLHPDSEWLSVTYNVSFCNNLTPYACNDVEFYDEINSFTDLLIDTVGVEEVMGRYLKNIINANTMWTNKDFSEESYVKISYVNENGENVDSYFVANYIDDFSVREEDQDDFNKLLNALVSSFKNKEMFSIDVDTFVKLGFGQEVFPSQEFPDEKERKNSGLSRVLSGYLNSKNEKIATFHAAKIGNAIRRIDDWHGNEINKRVAVDMFAPDLNFARIFRTSKNNFYALLENKFFDYKEALENGTVDEEMKNDLYFILACFIRGGVFNGASKK